MRWGTSHAGLVVWGGGLAFFLVLPAPPPMTNTHTSMTKWDRKRSTQRKTQSTMTTLRHYYYYYYYYYYYHHLRQLYHDHDHNHHHKQPQQQRQPQQEQERRPSWQSKSLVQKQRWTVLWWSIRRFTVVLLLLLLSLSLVIVSAEDSIRLDASSTTTKSTRTFTTTTTTTKLVPRRQLQSSSSFASTSTATSSSSSREVCHPCADRTEQVSLDINPACQELGYRSARFQANTNLCGASQLENFQSDCCSTPPLNYCTLCPTTTTTSTSTSTGSSDTGSFSSSSVYYNPTRIVPPFHPNTYYNGRDDDNDDEPPPALLTCQDLMTSTNDNDNNNNVNNDDHEEEEETTDLLSTYLHYLYVPGQCQDTLLQRSAAWCGCHGYEEDCTLCGNGHRPTFLDDRIESVYYGWSCATFEYVASFFNEQECTTLATTILEFDAAAYCGCPGSIPPTVCQLCDEDNNEESINADVLLQGDNGNNFTCHQLMESTRYIPTIETCDKVKASYQEDGSHDLCCGKKKKNSHKKKKKKKHTFPNRGGLLHEIRQQSPFVFWCGAVVLPLLVCLAGCIWYCYNDTLMYDGIDRTYYNEDDDYDEG
jgi:hypothetical protein